MYFYGAYYNDDISGPKNNSLWVKTSKNGPETNCLSEELTPGVYTFTLKLVNHYMLRDLHRLTFIRYSDILYIFYIFIITRFYIFFALIGFNVPFNTFQVISGHCLHITKDMITMLVLSHGNIVPQTQSYDIPPGHIILAKGQPVF